MTDTLAVIEPATEAVLEEVPRAGVEEVDDAVARARAALPGLARARARATRRAACARWPTRWRPSTRQLAVLEARNAGKPIADARGEIGMAIDDDSATTSGAPERLLGDTIPVAGGQAFTVPRAARRRRPDHAVELPADDRVLEARAGARGRQHGRAQAGRADAADRAALRRDRVDAGLPEGVVNVVVGPGRTCGQRLVEHPDVAKIAFTGLDRGRPLDRGGRRRDDQARDARARRQVAEHRVRGRRPRAAPRRAPRGRCSATPARTAARARGSSCRSAVLDRFMALLETAVKAIRVGDPLDEQTQMGPLISAGPARDRRLVRRRRRAGRDPRQRARRARLLVPADGAVPGRPRTTAPRARRSSGRSRA